MKVDYLAARQDIADFKGGVSIDGNLIKEVLAIVSRLAKPGETQRKEIDLNRLFAELARLDFSRYRAFEVAALLRVMGESLGSGIMVSDR